MKRLKKYAVGFLMALTVSTGVAPQMALAATPMMVGSTVYPTTIEELRQQDQGPDLSKGQLVSEVWDVEEDGTPYVERVYIKGLKARARTKLYTKSKSYGTTGSVDVWAQFDYNGKTVSMVADTEGGRFNPGGGAKLVSDNGATSSPNKDNTKVTVTYSCRVDRNLQGETTYKVSLYCNKDGKTDGKAK